LLHACNRAPSPTKCRIASPPHVIAYRRRSAAHDSLMSAAPCMMALEAGGSIAHSKEKKMVATARRYTNPAWCLLLCGTLSALIMSCALVTPRLPPSFFARSCGSKLCKPEKKEKTKECGICLQEKTAYGFTPIHCDNEQHAVCSTCAQKWAHKTTCPFCRHDCKGQCAYCQAQAPQAPQAPQNPQASLSEYSLTASQHDRQMDWMFTNGFNGEWAHSSHSGSDHNGLYL